MARIAASPAFAQILGKYFFVPIFIELLENLPLILLDYGEKQSGPANPAFNAAC
jgi:hypothetical protein